MWQIRDTWLPSRAIGTRREFSLFVAFRNESGQITAPRGVEPNEREFSGGRGRQAMDNGRLAIVISAIRLDAKPSHNSGC